MAARAERSTEIASDWRLDRPPPADCYVHLPDDFGRRFTVSVDTEEEFDWNLPFRRDGHGTSAIRALPRFQARMEAAAVAPLYLVNHAVVADEAAGETISALHRGGRCTIGAHLHPWATPPFEEALSRRNSFAGNLPRSLERAKLINVTEAIERVIGRRPDIFRAGRYGVGPNSAGLLVELGYRIDVSLRARFRYAAEGGPDFTHVRPFPCWLAGGRLLEIPLGGTYVGSLSPGPNWPDVNRRLVRLRALQRVALTPEGVPIGTAKAAVRRLIDEGVRLFSFSFHSPSLEPGHTPFVRTHSDVERFDRWWDDMLEFLSGEGVTPAGIDEIYAACSRGREAAANRAEGAPAASP